MSQYNDMSGLSLPTPSLDGQSQQMPSMPPAQQPMLAQPLQSPQQLAPTVAPPLQQYGTAPMPQQPQLVQVQQPIPSSQPVMPVSQPVDQPAQPPEMDDDSLDAEWINKAKAIVEQTHGDPYAESNALNQVKAEYLQRRYGKEIKVNK